MLRLNTKMIKRNDANNVLDHTRSFFVLISRWATIRLVTMLGVILHNKSNPNEGFLMSIFLEFCQQGRESVFGLVLHEAMNWFFVKKRKKILMQVTR